MTAYQDTIDKLFNLRTSKINKKNLDKIFSIADSLGNPHNDFPSVHVAGTNGKGSVCKKISECLILAGYKVGLFTSPHIFDFRERIQINREHISKENVVSFFDHIFKISSDLNFFEITTLMAFHYFSKNDVDIAVIETGLGGRLDATNILRPILSIITTIDYDHTAVLGHTLEAIAREKAGIIKKGVPVVVGEKALLNPIKEKAEILYIAKPTNNAIARESLKHIPFDSNQLGLKKKAPFRYEKRGDIIYDVAHNPSAFKYLFQKVKADFPNKIIHVLISISEDKKIDDSVEIIRNYADQIGILEIDHPRLILPTKLQNFIPEAPILSAKEAYMEAQKSKALLIITGSFYLMSKIELP